MNNAAYMDSMRVVAQQLRSASERILEIAKEQCASRDDSLTWERVEQYLAGMTSDEIVRSLGDNVQEAVIDDYVMNALDIDTVLDVIDCGNIDFADLLQAAKRRGIIAEREILGGVKDAQRLLEDAISSLQEMEGVLSDLESEVRS